MFDATRESEGFGVVPSTITYVGDGTGSIAHYGNGWGDGSAGDTLGSNHMHATRDEKSLHPPEVHYV